MRSYEQLKKELKPSSNSCEVDVDTEFKLEEDQAAEDSIKLDGLKTDDLLDLIFQGIDLKTYDGTPFTRSMLAGYLNSAIATAEQTFNICLSERTIEDEMHDIDGGILHNYQYTNLFKRPIKKINKIEYYLGNNKIMEVPDNWIQTDKFNGSFTLLPVGGAMGMLIPSNALGYTLPMFAHSNYLPMGIKVSYVAGIERDMIPANLIEYICKLAANSIFAIWGDQIIGAGIASASLSIDGLSQSIGTTQSAMYGGASARILEYRKDLDALTSVLRRYFARLDLVVL